MSDPHIPHTLQNLHDKRKEKNRQKQRCERHFSEGDVCCERTRGFKRHDENR